MGLGHLEDILKRLRAAGASAEHPAAVIARATLPDQQIVRGTLADILARVRELAVAPPALLIVGNVAAFTADATGCISAAFVPSGVADFTTPARPAAVAAGALT